MIVWRLGENDQNCPVMLAFYVGYSFLLTKLGGLAEKNVSEMTYSSSSGP